MEKWVQENLSKLLDFEVPDDLAQYITQIQDERDLESYLNSLLNNENFKHKQFITELRKRRATYNNQTRYKKTNNNDDIFNKPNSKEKEQTKQKVNVKDNSKSEKAEKKKTKFVNLYSEKEVLLKGRHKCDCEAKKHALINNCNRCGRIICKQEGSGPCFFCGNLISYPDSQIVLKSKTKQPSSSSNSHKSMPEEPRKDFEECLLQRDRLLEYDRNSACRTKVIDDELDYYQSNSIWLSAGEREILKKKEAKANAIKHASRLDRKINLNFMEGTIRDMTEDEFNQGFSNTDPKELSEAMLSEEFEDLYACPSIEIQRPTFIEVESFKTPKNVSNEAWNIGNIIHDKGYLEMSDQGQYLTIHQPYASLLVAGIKTHEGRTWYSPHRGRLWIASAAKVPTTEEISIIENTYRILKGENIVFPETYPTSYLLGCVTIIDVLPQDEYRISYPEGECDSPYVFICDDCYMLPIYFPIKGKNKIAKLDKKLHQVVIKSLGKGMKISNTC